MTSDWKEYKLSELSDIKGGKRLPAKTTLIQTKTVHPYIRVRDLTNKKILDLTPEFEYVDDETQKTISKYIVNEGDVIISIVGTIGLVAIIGTTLDKANLTENCAKFINLKKINNHFLYYYLISEFGQQEIKKNSVGAVQAKLPLYGIGDIKINLPPLETQQKIAKVLSAIDNKIELNNRINENLEQQAQAIFKSWFVNNDREYPVGQLSDIAEITMGQSPAGSSYNENKEGILFFQGRAEFGTRYPSPRLYTTEPKRFAKANDVLMSVRAPVGDVNIAIEDCCIGRGLASLRSKNGTPSYLWYTLLSLKKQLNVFNGEGTVFGSINKDSLNTMEINLIPNNEIWNFENVVSKLDKQIHNNFKENQYLTQLRDTLLPKLMSGEINVEKVGI